MTYLISILCNITLLSETNALRECIDTLAQAAETTPQNNTDWGIIIGVSGLILTALGLINRKKIALAFKRKWNKNQIAEELSNTFYSHYTNPIYIQPYFTFSSTDSNNSKQKKEELLQDYFFNKVFIKNTSQPKHYLILGDTGTGKTAALVHLYTDYIKKHPFKDNITILPLSKNSIINDINKIDNKKRKKHILLLDALDENPLAQDPNQLYKFSKELNEACSDFAFVLITCRPQLFSNKEDETTTIQARIGEQWIKYTRIELSDFNGYQVKKFLEKTYTSDSDNEKRNRAEEIVNKTNFIAIRPLILSHIKDIVDEVIEDSTTSIETTLDIYNIIIEKQIKRELEKAYPDPTKKQIDQWWGITSDVAGYMYRKNKYFITNQELDTIPSVAHEPQFKQRSMLTRTSNEFHFPHKSFYEYFMAYRFILYPEEIQEGTLYSMDFALLRYDELYNAYKEKHPVRFADLENLSIRNIANSLHNIGYNLYNLNHFSEAEPKYQVALEMFRQLEEQHPGQFIDDVAMTLNNLAVLHNDLHNYPAAEKEYTEALKTYHDLAEKDPDTYLPNVASILENLAVLHQNTNRYDEAEKEYNDVLNIRQKQAKNNPDAYLHKVAQTLNNLAVLHDDLHNYPAAEKEYTEALKIRRDLAEKNPDAFMPDVALTLNNLAVLHYNTNNYPAAEKEYTEALKIRRDLAEKNPDAFLPYVATTLNNLAVLHRNTNNYPAAEKEFTESLKIRRDLAKKNPDAFLPDVAMTLNNLAVLHRKTNNYPAAEKEYTEALKTYRDLAEKNPDAFLPDVAMTLYNMAILYLVKEEKDIPAAEAAAQESLEKYKIMAEKSHAAFDPNVKRGEELLAIIQQLKQQK